MPSGRYSTVIPPDLIARLRKPDAIIDGRAYWLLLNVAVVLDAARTTLQNWMSSGRVRYALKRGNAWLIPEEVLAEWATTGLPEPGTYPRLSRHNQHAKRSPERPAVGEPGSLVAFRPADPSAN